MCEEHGTELRAATHPLPQMSCSNLEAPCPSLSFSKLTALKVFEREYTETFWDGQVEAFEFFGGVPRRIVYDNSRVAVSQIIGGKERRLTQGFLQLQSHH